MSLKSSAAKAVLGVLSIISISSQAQAQQYYYTPGVTASQPAYYYTQPATEYQTGWTYVPQSYQAANAPQYYQYPYTPQYTQAADEFQVSADGRQIIPTSYVVPTAPAAVQPAVAQPVAAPQPAAVAQPVATPQPAAAAQPAASYGDPYGFLSWLNATRASYGLGAVGYDQNLSNWAAQNNNQQQAHGLGHFVMGPARRQNSAMGAGFPGAMWMASPAHRAALLDPTISWIGIAAAGAYWTFNAY